LWEREQKIQLKLRFAFMVQLLAQTKQGETMDTFLDGVLSTVQSISYRRMYVVLSRFTCGNYLGYFCLPINPADERFFRFGQDQIDDHDDHDEKESSDGAETLTDGFDYDLL
jgi:hypothetical protein